MRKKGMTIALVGFLIMLMTLPFIKPNHISAILPVIGFAIAGAGILKVQLNSKCLTCGANLFQISNSPSASFSKISEKLKVCPFCTKSLDEN